MAERLRAVVDLTYPDARSLPAVLAAGGLRQLTADQRAAVTFREVAAGEWCDDVPVSSRAWLLEQGQIERVTVDEREA